MDTERRIPLELKFLELLFQVDPTLAGRPRFAREFAQHLVSLAEAWASKSDIESHKRRLREWVRLNAPTNPEGFDYVKAKVLRDVASVTKPDMADE